MSDVVTEPPLTFEAYMAWEAEQPERHESACGVSRRVVLPRRVSQLRPSRPLD